VRVAEVDSGLQVKGTVTSGVLSVSLDRDDREFNTDAKVLAIHAGGGLERSLRAMPA
jgi:hypothetical protein